MYMLKTLELVSSFHCASVNKIRMYIIDM